jgi:sulfate permease, SulP family
MISAEATAAPGRALHREALSALAAMLVAVPAAIANGLVLYAPLGPAFTGAAALAGVVGAGVLGTIAPLLGGTPGAVSAPSPAAAAFMAALCAQLVAGGVAPAAIPGQLGLVVVVAGACQVAAGLLRLGRLVKYLPYPVVAGYLTGGGLLILHLQVSKLVGAPPRWGALRALAHPGSWQLAAVAISGATFAIALAAPGLTRRVPATLLGLAGGVLVHRLLSLRWPELALLDGNALLVGPVLSGAGSPVDAMHALAGGLSADALVAALVPGATLAVLLSIDTLKTCLLVDAATLTRHDSNRELVGQGVGNAASALLGGAPGTAIVSGSMVNVTSGARTRWSGALAGVLALAVLVGLGPALAHLPVPALAAIVALMAWRMLQKELVELLRDRSTLVDFGLAVSVVAVAVAWNLAAAAGVGVLLAIVLFLVEHTRTAVVRRELEPSMFASRRRSPGESGVLERHARDTLLVELQGSLFFGTADRVVEELTPSLSVRRFVILDLFHVRSVDLSAIHALKPVAARLAGRGGRLLLSRVPVKIASRLESHLRQLALDRPPFSVLVVPHVEDALEWAEERILGEQRRPRAPLALEEIDPVRGLPARVVEALRRVAAERVLAPGERLFSAGDGGRELFLVRSGGVRVLAPLEAGRVHLVTTVGAGDFLGELAYLDGGERSADAVAGPETSLFVLTHEGVARAAQEVSGLGVFLSARIAVALSRRLRRATAEARRLWEA